MKAYLQTPKFYTNFRYRSREEKAKYVWLKYQTILQGTSILDVGADGCYLKSYLDEQSSYWGIGLGGTPDQHVNLEKELLPFDDNSFDCVLCIDVLEHLENIHAVFDELCRVSKRSVIFSLPNAYNGFLAMLYRGDYRPGTSIKFYGLPLEPPEDRHKWFFSFEEAENFVHYRAAKNRMRVLQIDNEYVNLESHQKGLRRWGRLLARTLLFRRDFNAKNLYVQTLWVVLEKDKG